MRSFLPALSAAFLAVFCSGKPVVAAVNGHAIAGGAILACACDRRVMDDSGGQFGVTELRVGVPFPPVALEILGTRSASDPPATPCSAPARSRRATPTAVAMSTSWCRPRR